MPARRAASGGFQPVIMFSDRTPVDDAAVKMIYSIQRDLFETMDTERNRQQKIGISEIGMECRRCVARKLSMEFVEVPSTSWKAQVGTFIHAGLEDHFSVKYAVRRILASAGLADLAISGDEMSIRQIRERASDEAPIYLTERRLQILLYKGLDLGGSCDMVVIGATFCIVVDWKTQGSEKLRTKTAKGTIGQQYTVQMQTYGLGYELLGLHPTHVLLYALPRDGELDDAKPVLLRYDKTVAIEALAKLTQLIDAAELVGWEAVIVAQPRSGFCFDCNRYESQEDDAFMRGLVGGK